MVRRCDAFAAVVAAGAALALGLAGCASPRFDVPHPVSSAWPAPRDTPIAQAYADQFSGRDDRLSGLHPLPGGMEALAARAALAESSRHTLDLQYYIVRDDTTTRALMARLLAASQRGVRVRLLVDDLDAAGKDADLASLAAFPNIEVRVFNPFSIRGRFGLAQVVEFLGNPLRLNRRMHNKLWVADNAMAVIGGRNLGDEYFDASGKVNFSDLDMLVAGPAVTEISRSFDAYWNSEWAVPIQAFQPTPDAAELERFQKTLRERVDTLRGSEYGRALLDGGRRFGMAVRAGEIALAFAPVEIFADPPTKVAPSGRAAPMPSAIAARAGPVVAHARSEVILVSPYFIPSEQGFALMRGLVDRGVRVRVLTNSLASADVVPLAHAGYATHRQRLLAAGVELHEMRPEQVERVRHRVGHSSGAYLHTKAIVVDRQHVLVGSMNLDPRSRLSNTEVALLARSGELGELLGRLFDDAVRPDRAFRVQLAGRDDAPAALQWVTEENGRPAVYDQEPLVGFWRRVFSGVLGAIAPQALL